MAFASVQNSPPLLSLPASALKSFVHSISQKWHGKNYLLWLQQVEPVIKSHLLHHYLVNPIIP